MLKSLFLVIALVSASRTFACALHGDEDTHEERRTLIVQLIDQIRQLRRGFVPADAPLTLPEVAGVTCTIQPAGVHLVGEVRYEQHKIECTKGGKTEYTLTHDCRPEHQDLPEKMWNNAGPMGMTVLTLSVDCV